MNDINFICGITNGNKIDVLYYLIVMNLNAIIFLLKKNIIDTIKNNKTSKKRKKNNVFISIFTRYNLLTLIVHYF